MPRELDIYWLFIISLLTTIDSALRILRSSACPRRELSYFARLLLVLSQFCHSVRGPSQSGINEVEKSNAEEIYHEKSVITCLMLVLAFGGIGLFRVPRVSAQSATTTEFDLALHCAGPAPVSGSAQLTVQMSPAIMATPYQLNCSDSTDRGATQHFVLAGTLASFSGAVQANGDGMGTSCAFAGTSLPFEITCADGTSTPTRRVRFSLQ